MNPKFSIAKIISTGRLSDRNQKELQALLGRAEELEAEFLFYDITGDEDCRKLGRTFAENYPGAVTFLEMPGSGMADCYNDFLRRCQGHFLQFSKITTTCSEDSFQKVRSAFQEHHASMVSLFPVQTNTSIHTPQILFKYKQPVIHLADTPLSMHLVLDAFFVNRELVDGPIPETLVEETGLMLFLIRLLERAKAYVLLDSPCNLDDYTCNDRYNYASLYKKEWYSQEIRETLIPFLKEKPDSQIRQAGTALMIQMKFSGNSDDRNKRILSETELDDFFAACRELFQLMDDQLLVWSAWMDEREYPHFMGVNYLRMKYPDKCPLIQNRQDPTGRWGIVWDETFVEYYDSIAFRIIALNHQDQGLVFEGEVLNVQFADYDRIHFYLCHGKEKIPAQRTEIYSLNKYFGRSLKKGYMVRVVLARDVYEKDCFRFHFEVEYDGHFSQVKCNFSKFQSRLHKDTTCSYWKFDGHLLKYLGANQGLLIQRCTPVRHVSCELQLLAALMKKLRKPSNGVDVKRALSLRFLYWLTRPFYGNKGYWITFDQLFKGGDNGEYFFRYVREHHPEVPIYYILNEDAPEYPELKRKYGHVLKYGSWKAALLSLNARLVFATRVGVNQYLGIKKFDEYYARDLFHADVVCLQHGLTIQKIAQYQNRLFDNTKLYYCVSPREVENIKKPIYGYDDSMIALTGAPRYDGLLGAKPRRQILITPTWRRSGTAGTNDKGKNYDYSVNFRSTVYYQIYNTLINDKRLIDCARRTGYRVVYLLHPILSPQLEDFEKNDFVDILPGTQVNYEKILRESKLMVTDYSGVQFDFAYMKKPLVYYRPSQLPPQYEEEDFGFGPICTTNEEMVHCLCGYMEKDCLMEEEYRKNIEKFFPYEDASNCARAYEATLRKFGH